MKKTFKKIGLGAALATFLFACHKIEVDVTTELTPDNFPQTESQFNSVMGPVYTAFRDGYTTGHFFATSQSTDESVLATYAADWVDGNRYLDLHRHTWTKDHVTVAGEWNYFQNLIGISNQTLYILKQAADGPAKSTGVAELRTMRAWFYWNMMDMFGGVPLDTAYPSTELKARAPRADVFNFIESELKAAIPSLKTVSGGATYGKPTRYMAYSLLAKMYLNAEVYTGSAKWNECIAACDSVIGAGGGSQYSLEPMNSYLQMFYPNNGPSTKEFIFAIPYDPATSAGYNFHARYDLNRRLGMKYKYAGSTVGNNVDPVVGLTTGNGLQNNSPSGPRMTTSEFYAYFNDPNDIRNKQWLTGLQYWDDGKPIMVKTSNLGYDQFYNGGSPNADYIYQLELKPLTVSRLGANAFDLGKDEIAWNTGYRNIKFFPDAASITRNQNNDVPVFRFSDIILMKAEAIERGGSPTLGHTALSLMNMLRAVRTTSAPLANLTLEDIYAERCREMSWECWHRNDMIRFGHFEDPWGLSKTNNETYRRLFPIPSSAIATNGKLEQNPGY